MEKNYINWAYIYEINFKNWWQVLNMNIDVNSFIDQITKIKDEKWYAKLVIAWKREKIEWKPTHYIYENFYKEKKDDQKENTDHKIDPNSLPF